MFVLSEESCNAPADGFADKDVGDVVDDGAVGIAHEWVALRLGVNPDQPLDAHLQARFLIDFAHHGLLDGFAEFDLAAGHAPKAVVRALLQQDFAGLVADKAIGRCAEPVGHFRERRARVVAPLAIVEFLFTHGYYESGP